MSIHGIGMAVASFDEIPIHTVEVVDHFEPSHIILAKVEFMIHWKQLCW